MNYTLRLERLRAKVAKLSVAQHPPILRLVQDNAGEAQTNPEDLTEWDLVINGESKWMTTPFKLLWDGLNKARMKVARSVLNALVPLIEKNSSKEDPSKKEK